jgi:hypothetical protein
MGKELVAYVKEHGDHIYIQAPVTLYEPDDQEIAALTYGQQVTAAASLQKLKEQAPNPKILWLQGRYVEADNANRNGDQWTAGDLAIKALTPVLMPITVMHDFRTAVGTIADTTLRLPKDHPDVPRARIETVAGRVEAPLPRHRRGGDGQRAAGHAHAVDGVHLARLRLLGVRPGVRASAEGRRA